MKLEQAIRNRRSIRKFSDDKVDEKIINAILESGIWAPSACNHQEWKFIIIDNKKLMNRIIDLGGSVVISAAPIGILVLYKNQTDNLEYNDHIQSASACIQNMLLKSHSLGLGSCWICQLPNKNDLRGLLHIPHHYDPIAYIALGYPSDEPKPHKRNDDVEQLVSYNNYNFKVGEKGFLKINARRIFRRFYFKLPLFIKKAIRSKIEKKYVKKFE